MQTQKPLISVVIPHLNQLEELDCCLRSLDQQSVSPELFEVIIADNGSEILPNPGHRGYPIRVVQELQPGPGAARNRGASEANGEILAFIDADCRAHRDWLRSAQDKMQSKSTKTILGGDVQIWRDDATTFSSLEAYEGVFAYRFQLYIEQHGFCGTGNLVVRREAFQEIGPFKGIQFAEDIEWGRSVRAAGYKFEYVPDMIVYHPARKTLEELFTKWDRHIQHAVNALREGQGRWQPKWVLRAFAILVSPAVESMTVLRSPRISGGSARMKGIAILIAVRSYRFFRMLTVLRADKQVVWNRSNVITSTDL